MKDNDIPNTLPDTLNKNLEAPKIDPVHLSVANDYLEGMDIIAISKEYDVDADVITAIIEKPEVQKYIDNVYLSQGFLNRNKRLEVINKVIIQKIEDAEITGELSKKDLLDWMKLLMDMEKNIKPSPAKGPAVAVQINNYEKLMDKLTGDE